MCKHFFQSTVGHILGDVVGAVAGAFLGPEVFGLTAGLGGAIGGAIGGAGSSAIGGGKIGQDVLSGALGAAGGYGIGSALGPAGLGLAGAADAGAAGGAADAVGAASDLGITGTAPIVPVTSEPLMGVAPAAQPTATLGSEVAAPTVAQAGASPSSAISALGGPPSGTGLPPDVFIGGSTSEPAATADATAPTGAPAALPEPPIPPANFNAMQGQDLGQGQFAPGATVEGVPSGPTAAGSPDLLTRIGNALGLNDTGTASSSDTSTLGKIANSPITRLAGTAVSGLGLMNSLSKANQPNPIPNMSNVSQIAGQAQTQSGILESYLQNGTLPPAVQASVDQATQDGVTAIKSRYAQMGVAPGSAAETQDIARLKQSAVVQGAQLADQLLQQGISLSQLSGQLYGQLVGVNQQLNTQTNQAIANLATALSGSGAGGTPVKLVSANA